MGRSYLFKCPKCGYSLNAELGMGMADNWLMDKYEKEVKHGDYGPVLQKAVREENTFVNTARVLGVCESCGEYSIFPSLLICKNEPVDENEDGSSIFESIASAEHSCVKCGGKVRIIRSDVKDYNDPSPLTCPKCHTEMEETEYGLWD